MTMQHPNKNRLLEYFYKEGSAHELQKTQEHLQFCPQCREYPEVLKATSAILDQLPTVAPEKNICDIILQDIAVSSKQSVQKKRTFSVMPFFQITLSIPFILAILYFIQNKLTGLSVWESMEKIQIINTLGSFGFVAVLFFLIGSFVTLSLAPVLLFDSENKTYLRKSYKLLWR